MIDADQRLAEELRSILKQKRITGRALSELLQLPYRTVQNYLNGTNRIPAGTLLLICDIVGIEPDYLLSKSFNIDFWPLFDALGASLKDSGLFPKIEFVGDPIEGGRQLALRRAALMALTTRVIAEYQLERASKLSRTGPTPRRTAPNWDEM